MVAEREKVLAFDVEARKTLRDVDEQFREELNGKWSLGRPDLFGFGGGAIEHVATGEIERFGPEDLERMLRRLEAADLIVTSKEAVSELGILGVPFDSPLREKHLNLVVGYEFEGTDDVEEYWKGEDGAVLFAEGRTEELLDLSESRARWTAEAYRAARHLRTGSPRLCVERDDGTRKDLALWNITVGYAWGPRKPY